MSSWSYSMSIVTRSMYRAWILEMYRVFLPIGILMSVSLGPLTVVGTSAGPVHAVQIR